MEKLDGGKLAQVARDQSYCARYFALFNGIDNQF